MASRAPASLLPRLQGIATQGISRTAPQRQFWTTGSSPTKNRIYEPVRRPDDFWTYHALAAGTQRAPLVTLWTASYCSTCLTVAPALKSLIEAGVGEQHGGISFCEVEYDAPDVMSGGLGMTFMITKLPTLLAFRRGEALTDAKVVDPKCMTDRDFLDSWIGQLWRRG